MVVKFIWPSISISSICVPQGRRHVIRLCGSLVHSSLLQFVIKLFYWVFFLSFVYLVTINLNQLVCWGNILICVLFFIFFLFIRTQFSRDYGTFAFYHIEDNWSLYWILTLWANVPRYYSEIPRKDIMVVDVWQLYNLICSL